VNWSFTTLLIIKITSWERSLTFGRDECQLLIPSVSVRVIGDEKQSTPTLCHVVLNSFLLSVKQCHLVCPRVILRSCVLWIEYALLSWILFISCMLPDFTVLSATVMHRELVVLVVVVAAAAAAIKRSVIWMGYFYFISNSPVLLNPEMIQQNLCGWGVESPQILGVLCNHMSNIAFWLTWSSI